MRLVKKAYDIPGTSDTDNWGVYPHVSGGMITSMLKTNIGLSQPQHVFIKTKASTTELMVSPFNPTTDALTVVP